MNEAIMLLNSLLQTAAAIVALLSSGKKITAEDLRGLRARAKESEDRLLAAIAAKEAEEAQGG